MIRTLLYTLLLSIASNSFCQPLQFPKNYFSLPINIAVSLAGNFGDLRTNHYHMGLDFRTQQKENLPVTAAAEGYVSRIKIEPYGYGRAIYITHPNGLVTLYAHLNNFYEPLEKYVRAEQYASKKWQQDLAIPPNRFVVKKGQFIAYSGNTGGSEGPHLHFEIRDATTGHNYNPLLFGMGIMDNIPPTIYRLAWYNRNSSIYNSRPQFEKIQRQTFKGKAVGSTYETVKKIVKVPMGKFSLGIGAEDKTNSSFMFGIYGASLFLDQQLVCSFTMHDFNYADSRYINADIDYATRYDGGPYIQHLSQLPGSRIPIFDSTAGNGMITLQDDTTHQVKIVVTDIMGNSSKLEFMIQRDTTLVQVQTPVPLLATTIVPNTAATYQNDSFSITLSANAVYDTVAMQYSSQQKQAPYMSAIHRVANYHIPMHDSATISIKANATITAQDKENTVMILRSGKKFDVQKPTWNGDWATAKWWHFGELMLWRDTIKPTIIPVNIYDSAVFIKDQKLVFTAKDETGDLATINGFIDGQWVIFKQKNNTYTYDFDDRCLPGWHTVTLTATDAAGNTNEKTYTFNNGAIIKP